MLTTKIVERAGDIPIQVWDSFFKYQAEDRGFYSTLEEADIGPFKYYYLLIIKDAQVVAIAPMFFMNFKVDMFAPLKAQKIIEKIRCLLKNFLSFKTLICGSPVTDYGFIGFAADLNNKKAIFELINIEIQKFAKKLKASSYGYKDFGKEFKELDIFTKQGFVKVMDYPCVLQNLRGKSFDDFLKSFNSSKRNDLKRKIKKINSLPSLKLEIKNALTQEELKRVYELYLATYERSDVHFEKLTKEFFEKIQTNMSQTAKFFIYQVEDKIVAFNLCFIKGNVFLDKFLGFDYDYLHKYNLFFNRFFMNLDWCYKNSIKVYQSGQTDYNAKLQLGGRLKTVYIYGRHMNCIINFILKPLFFIAQPKNFDPIFKLISKYRFD